MFWCKYNFPMWEKYFYILNLGARARRFDQNLIAKSRSAGGRYFRRKSSNCDLIPWGKDETLIHSKFQEMLINWVGRRQRVCVMKYWAGSKLIKWGKWKMEKGAGEQIHKRGSREWGQRSNLHPNQPNLQDRAKRFIFCSNICKEVHNFRKH